ncbi:MAG: hypothetical protein R2911_44830 [Caldilineaceae bacterium]
MPLLILLIIALFAVGMVWRRTRAAKQRRQQIAQLRRWATEHNALEPALQQWIQRLSTTEAEVLLELLNGYCTSLNWELNWLFAPQIQKAPALKMVLEESVSAYARAILHSLQMEADVAAFHAYVAFEKKPNARKQRPLVQQLYAKVNDAQLTPPTKRFLGRFARKEASTKAQVAAIQQAFERDPARAMAALKQVLATEAAFTVAQVRQELTPPVLLSAAGAAA